MASPSELTLDCKIHSYSVLLKSFGDHQIDQTQKLEEVLSLLEKERLKIEAFKRELPLCMQLLTNGTSFFFFGVHLDKQKRFSIYLGSTTYAWINFTFDS